MTSGVEGYIAVGSNSCRHCKYGESAQPRPTLSLHLQARAVWEMDCR